MVLSQPTIRKAVASKKIRFDPPLEEDQWGEASVDLRLGFSFTTLQAIPNVKVSVARGLEELGRLGFWKTIILPEKNEQGEPSTFLLKPQQLVLGMTHESVTVPLDMIGLVEGRTTYARVGLSMHQTAPWIQPGWDGPIVLEITNSGPLTIELTPLIDRPCQLSFLKLDKKLLKHLGYGARSSDVYQHQKHPFKIGKGTS
ncbi:dCTP deaminase [Candidatus Binatus sp.]|jgi:dCTP deaminase|uniref:dCTP deaminase n=1 Tax=Candidatus Binatus sp. TaxID=2811406 RepID=UPI002FD961E2